MFEEVIGHLCLLIGFNQIKKKKPPPTFIIQGSFITWRKVSNEARRFPPRELGDRGAISFEDYVFLKFYLD